MGTSNVSIYERESFIASYLQRKADSSPEERTIRSIWEAAQQPHNPPPPNDKDIRDPGGIGGGASLSTYHRTVGKLVSQGKLDVDTQLPDGTKCYKVADRVSSVTPFSQQDMNRMLWEMDPATAMSVYARVNDLFEENKDRILGKVAEGLLQEDPRDLILQMLKDRALDLDHEIANLKDESIGSSSKMREQLERDLRQFSRFAHGELGINPSVWKVPLIREIDESKVSSRREPGRHVRPANWDGVADELRMHVFGDTFLGEVEIEDHKDQNSPLVVAGTDGSSHVGLVRGLPAAAYNDMQRVMLTFNNSASFVDVPEGHYGEGEREPASPYHGVPISRAALEDPQNKGMFISRPWFPDLEDGQYEHMKKVALDVVQFRIDEDLITGSAMPYGSNSVGGDPPLPKPDLHLRDGTVTPQAREWSNYKSKNAYGEMVREGINLSYSILRSIRDSRHRVFAGAVKNTRLKVFSKIINWYIQRGSKKTFGEPIDPNWEASQMSNIPDSTVMSELISAAPDLNVNNRYYRTCVIARPFPSMVSKLRRVDSVEDPEEWYDVFSDWKERDTEKYKEHGGPPPFLYRRDVYEDEYVRMCVYADYGMFYFGKPGGSPELQFPRFDFMDSIRHVERGRQDVSRAETKVQRTVETIMRGVHQTKWAQDYDHNMFDNQKLPKLTPFVVYDAHEKSKSLGHKLASELQQAIAERLSHLIDENLPQSAMPTNVEIEPVPADQARKEFKRIANAAKQMGEGIADEPSPGGDEPEDLPEDESGELPLSRQ